MTERSPVAELRREASAIVWQIIGNPADADAVDRLLEIEDCLEELAQEDEGRDGHPGS